MCVCVYFVQYGLVLNRTPRWVDTLIGFTAVHTSSDVVLSTREMELNPSFVPGAGSHSIVPQAFTRKTFYLMEDELDATVRVLPTGKVVFVMHLDVHGLVI